MVLMAAISCVIRRVKQAWLLQGASPIRTAHPKLHPQSFLGQKQMACGWKELVHISSEEFEKGRPPCAGS